MSKEIAISIPLNVWQDPQGDVVLHYSRADCTVSFGCWDTQGEPAGYICQLKFSHAWAARAGISEFLPYELVNVQSSCIYEVRDSRWLALVSNQRSQDYPQWKDWDRKSYHHYVVHGHDNYVEVIADSFLEVSVPREEAGELVRLIDEA